MPRPLRLQAPGALHHVIVRGNEQRPVFFEDADRADYLDRLRRYHDRFGFFLYAYCLMTNHVHLAIEQRDVGISRIMHALQSSYAQSINRRHERVGHLFQGRFKSFLVDGERYLLTLLRYIHRNPVESRIVARPEAYFWSSDRFLRSGRGPDWLDVDRVLRLLAGDRRSAIARYRGVMGDVTSARDSSYADLPALAGTVKADEAFAARVLRDVPRRRSARQAVAPQVVATTIARLEGTTLDRLSVPGKVRSASRARVLAAFIGRDRFDIPVARFARLFGRDESTLVRGVLAMERRIALDPGFRRRLDDLAAAADRELLKLHG